MWSLWAAFPTRYVKASVGEDVFVQAAKNVRAAGQAEAKAIEHIKAYLSKMAEEKNFGTAARAR